MDDSLRAIMAERIKAVQARPQSSFSSTHKHNKPHNHSSTMSCIASSFVGSVAALKATKVQVSFTAFPLRSARRALF
jgi:hypothetical protein